MGRLGFGTGKKRVDDCDICVRFRQEFRQQVLPCFREIREAIKQEYGSFFAVWEEEEKRSESCSDLIFAQQNLCSTSTCSALSLTYTAVLTSAPRVLASRRRRLLRLTRSGRRRTVVCAIPRAGRAASRLQNGQDRARGGHLVLGNGPEGLPLGCAHQLRRVAGWQWRRAWWRSDGPPASRQSPFCASCHLTAPSRKQKARQAPLGQCPPVSPRGRLAVVLVVVAEGRRQGSSHNIIFGASCEL